MDIKREDIAKIVEEVLTKYSGKSPVLPTVNSRSGIFDTMEEAINSAVIAQKQYRAMSLEDRKRIIASMRKFAEKNIKMLSETAVSETGMGVIEDKMAKHRLCIAKTPGVEDLETKAFTGDGGMTLVEMAPYGVIGSITPSTNPSTTVINNSISMLSAGNAVVYNPHPQAKRVSQRTVEILNEAVVAAGGPANLMTTVENPTFATGSTLMKSPDIKLLAVTGGPEIVSIAMKSGKKVIAAGPGNPPVVVDETADIKKAAKDIVTGASFDCNIMCIAEKEVFVVESVFNQFKDQMLGHGAYELTRIQTDELTRRIMKEGPIGSKEPVLDRNFVGKPAYIIAKAIGLDLPMSTKLLIADVAFEHPLVKLEQLMPFIPLVRARNVNEAIDMAVEAENAYAHTASMFSTNVASLTRMGLMVNTTIFVKNAPTLAGLGFNGEGHTTLTISTPTGEGITSARTFTRQRRCALVDYFRIV